MKKLLLFFVDGIGLGEDTENNYVKSLFSTVTGNIRLVKTLSPQYFKNGVVVPVDACLGVEGIPQSATGQATIFTGVNASALLGYHLTAIPNEELVKLVSEKSLMKVLMENGISVTSANLYSKEFFKEREGKRKNKFPVSTLTIKASGVPFRYEADYKAGKAVFADITNRLLRGRGYNIDLISPQKAGKNLLNVLRENRFVFFEYFMTDTYSHKQNISGLREAVSNLSMFLKTVINGINGIEGNGTAVLVVSDHGNAEDLSTSGHTKNKVPVILFTRDNYLKDSISKVSTLEDIYPWVLKYFDCPIL